MWYSLLADYLLLIRMSPINLCLIFAVLFAVAICEIPPAKQQSRSPYLKIAPGNADFAFRFYHQIASEETGKNIFFSPISIATAFACLSLGAKSTTLSQLLSGLGFNQTKISEREIHKGFHHLLHVLNRPEAEIELSLGNALFTHDQYKLLKKFLNDAKHFYHAEVLPTNFKKPEEAVKQINNYIEKKTHGKLVNVVKQLDPKVVVVLVNYIYLKAYWKNPFNYEFTRKDDFFVDEQTTVQVPMMNKDSNFNFYHDEELSCQVVHLPYKGDASALFILPDPGKLKQVEAALGTDVLIKWGKSLKQWRLELFLPRFSLFTSYDVESILNKLGVTDVFTDHADLSRITGARNVKVSKAIHKTFLNVHENGTEAAATTVIEIVPTSLLPIVKIDRPFFFLIIDELTNCILFMGKVKNPKQAHMISDRDGSGSSGSSKKTEEKEVVAFPFM
ncbi:alpha-1-antitrypsin-like [Pogona vitticeps]